MKRQILLYGLVLGLLTLMMSLAQYRLVVLDHATELFGFFVALMFTVLGIWMGLKITSKREVIVEKIVPAQPFILNELKMEELGISKRELEVLQLISDGLSNQQIADHLHVSLSTIKTHSSKLFEKLGVSRRTQAVLKAKDLSLIP